MVKDIWNRIKFWMIWFGCLDQPRTIQQMMKKWDYSIPSGGLYRKKLINAMLEQNFIKVVQIGKNHGGNYYQSIRKDGMEKLFDKFKKQIERYKSLLEMGNEYFDVVR